MSGSVWRTLHCRTKRTIQFETMYGNTSMTSFSDFACGNQLILYCLSYEFSIVNIYGITKQKLLSSFQFNSLLVVSYVWKLSCFVEQLQCTRSKQRQGLLPTQKVLVITTGIICLNFDVSCFFETLTVYALQIKHLNFVESTCAISCRHST